MSMIATLAMAELSQGYAARRFSVTQVMEEVLARIDAAPERHVWISRLPRERVLAFARALCTRSPGTRPSSARRRDLCCP